MFSISSVGFSLPTTPPACLRSTPPSFSMPSQLLESLEVLLSWFISTTIILAFFTMFIINAIISAVVLALYLLANAPARSGYGYSEYEGGYARWLFLFCFSFGLFFRLVLWLFFECKRKKIGFGWIKVFCCWPKLDQSEHRLFSLLPSAVQTKFYLIDKEIDCWRCQCGKRWIALLWFKGV